VHFFIIENHLYKQIDSWKAEQRTANWIVLFK